MKRKILTFENEQGQTEDLIPYVDDLAIQIGGTNLRDYLAQIEDNLEVSKLFLGAFTSETSLLEKYPDGIELPVGTYAIVSDVDALYIYDTDSLRWLRTASATTGILQLNGLSPINGSLTITGGDINSTVPNADNTPQTITNHLNDLNEKQKSDEQARVGSIAYDYSLKTPTFNSSVFTFRFSVYDIYAKSRFLYARLRSPSSTTGINENARVEIEVEYESGEIKRFYLYTANYTLLTYKDLINYLSYPTSQPYVLIDLYADHSNGAVVISLIPRAINKTPTYTIFEDRWVDNEEGTGYKYVVTVPTTSPVYVLSVYKKVNDIKTTAIVDYKTENNVITIYSDDKFAGGITTQYTI